MAGELALRAFEQAGFTAPDVVAAQAAPDPDFPTVAFPNPEEPGALDLALAQARRSGADLVLANDPDGDRLAVAVPDPDAPGGWRMLTGDQVGALLGAYLLERTPAGPDPDDRLVVTTIVSSTLLSRIAAAAGAQYAETLTGFKWIVRAGELPAAVSSSATRRRSGTRSATSCGTRTGSGPPWRCSASRPGPGPAVSRCSTPTTRSRPPTACT